MKTACPFSPTVAIVENLSVAFFMILMWSLISLDPHAEQESFNRGGIYLVAATTLAYLLPAAWLARRKSRHNSPSTNWFIRRGGMTLLLAGMLIYIAIMSIRAGRVL